MPDERRAPTRRQVVWAIARRELGLAYRRRIVRILFLASLLPPLVMATILVVRVMAREMVGHDLGWDPLLWLLRVQALPVALLALGLGTPAVARDRSEDVLYLYAVRPVTPTTYAVGKFLAVYLPTALLLWMPAILIVGLREGILGDAVAPGDTGLLALKASWAALVIAFGYAGISLGPSALLRRARWALLIALLVLGMPEPLKLFRGSDAISIGPASAARDLLDALFSDAGLTLGIAGAAVLLAYGTLGAWITRARVRQEMIP